VRFKEERLRWEAETGYKLRGRPGFTGNAVTMIENGMGKMKTDVRITIMTQLGMDVLYILNGVRTKTPIERDFEKRMRAINTPAPVALLEG
jgi:hypothetical protein